MRKLFYTSFSFVLVATFSILLASPPQATYVIYPKQKPEPLLTSLPTITPSPSPASLPTSKTLNSDYHIFQTFNNCGPASLSMALSYYGIQKSQDELGNKLRPYQNPQGDNDDKSVTLEELSNHSKVLGFATYHRPNGNMEILKKFIALDIPVITRTWTKPGEDIGHFRVVKGYNDTQKTIVQDDSLQGKNLIYTYSDFEGLWKSFNYEYLVLIPKEKEQHVKKILGVEIDEKVAWENSVMLSMTVLEKDPEDYNARFNLSVAYFHLGRYSESVTEFEKVESRLPFRTLWYQIEPIEAYFQLGKYNRVMEISDRILKRGNKAFSELYFLRGQIYQKQGRRDLAREEFDKAVFFNSNLENIAPNI